ncbi:DNA polymerase III subunit gamma/tau [Parachitinimonas caeni]|uniref:DNA polymerase III subunit gamma/tau n=1 Tax=Parachitinimonas caeni TaxID=3031301 RepID=A0ABT7DYH4_9NEIS|nr:DNA polymerase III subunit gamma/tau [Parachitinimonas caeni]MDK2123717.1 DNA polymerase III subunit gamma/tau [Parachitinimonas caeni]
MAYQVLARKWRPKTFDSLIGQEHVIKALSNALETQRLHHAYLLTGTRGVGKTTIARILAKSLNCETGITAHPCGNCTACRQIDGGRFVDLLEIDAASNTGIDNIREVLDSAQYTPTAGRFKVYIIDEVHMLSKSAFNAMLKTLEEPPGHVKFILATTDPQKVPVTVLSRCLQFSLRQMVPSQVAAYLATVLTTEDIPYESPALALLGRAAAGSMRDALSLLDQAIAYGSGRVETGGVQAMLGAVDHSYLLDLCHALALADGKQLIAQADKLQAQGVPFDHALLELSLLLHKIALVQALGDEIATEHPQAEGISALAQAMTPEMVQLYYQIALTGRKDLGLAPDEYAGFTMCLIRMLAFTQAAPSQPAGHKPPQPAVIPNATASQFAHHATTKPAQQATQSRNASKEQVARQSPDVPPIISHDDGTTEAGLAAEQINTPLTDMSRSIAEFDGDWAGLLEAMKLGGQAKMLGPNCSLKSYREGCFELVVPDTFKTVAGPSYRESLREAICHHFGTQIEIQLIVGGDAEATPAAQNERARQERQRDAEASINHDPFVQTLVSEFGATILPGSIKPA